MGPLDGEVGNAGAQPFVRLAVAKTPAAGRSVPIGEVRMLCCPRLLRVGSRRSPYVNFVMSGEFVVDERFARCE